MADTEAKYHAMARPRDLEEKRCTDCCCLILFVISWLVLGLIAVGYHEPSRIVHGTDYLGRHCDNMVWYPRIAEYAYEQADVMQTRPWDVHLYGLCVAKCPEQGERVADYGYAESPASKAASWDAALPTFSVLNRCVPREERTYHIGYQTRAPDKNGPPLIRRQIKALSSQRECYRLPSW